MDSWKMIEGYIAEKGAIERDVLSAIEFSYKSATRESKERTDGRKNA
jgi:hypothetical protein